LQPRARQRQRRPVALRQVGQLAQFAEGRQMAGQVTQQGGAVAGQIGQGGIIQRQQFGGEFRQARAPGRPRRLERLRPPQPVVGGEQAIQPV
jgi:hypothetical protein